LKLLLIKDTIKRRNREAVHKPEKGLCHIYVYIYEKLKTKASKMDKNVTRHLIKDNTQMQIKNEKEAIRKISIQNHNDSSSRAPGL
jgi:hypothetical protein